MVIRITVEAIVYSLLYTVPPEEEATEENETEGDPS